MNNKEKVLLVIPFAPWPITSGGSNRLHNTITKLSKESKLTILQYQPHDQAINRGLINFYHQHRINFTIIESLPKKHFSYLHFAIPYWFSDWHNLEIAYTLKELFKNNSFDRVQIEFSQLLFLSKYLPRKIKSVFVAHDIATVSFYRRMLEQNNPLKFILQLKRLLEVYLYEKRYLKKYSEIIAVSENDKKLLLKHFVRETKINVQNNGIAKINFLAKKDGAEIIRIGYIGSMKHPPNIHAIKTLLNVILPSFAKKRRVQLILAGDNSDAEIYKVTKNKEIINLVENMGLIDKVEDFYEQIDVLVAPIISGSGTRIKILEALSYGKAVITTAIGAEGLTINSPYLQITNHQWVETIEKSLTLQNKSDLEKLEEQLKKYLW